MATLVELNLALQSIQNLAGLQRDMVGNAQFHKSQAVGGKPLAPIIQAMQACAASYQTRLGWVSVVTGDSAKLAQLTTGLTALGGSMANANASVGVLQSAVTALVGAVSVAATVNDVTAACDALLAAVPAPVVMY